MTVRTASLVMELLDRVTGPARRVAGSLRGLGNTVRDMPNGANFGTHLDAAMARTNAAIDRSKLAVVEATATAWAFSAALSAPIRAAGNFETALEGIGQKAGLPVERLGALGDRIKGIAKATNTSASDIAAAVDGLVGRGMDVDAALAVADPIARAAVAYGASTEDLAATAMTAVDNMKIPADQVLSVFDALAQAGKDGAFELRDMAAYLPTLGAQYAAMGQQGVGALSDLGAAAQVLRKDTGDASTAATRLQNVLQKTYSPATIEKFADKGVDLIAEMEKAAQRGLTPLEAIAAITEKTLGGDLTKIGFLFEDAEAQAGIRSLILHQQEFQRIRAEALKAQGVVMKDYERRVRTAQGAQRRWAASVESLNIALGNTLLPLLNQLLDRIVPIINSIGDLATRFPEVTRGIASATGALIAFRASMAALKLIGLTGKGGVLSLAASAFSLFGSSVDDAGKAVGSGRIPRAMGRLRSMLRGIALVLPGVSMIGSALTAIGAAIAGISAPVWGTIVAVVAAIAAAGYTAWKYWDRMTAVLSGVGRAVGEILAPAFEAIRPMLDWFSPLGDLIAAGWKKAGDALRAVGDWLGSFFQREVLSEDDKRNAEQSGYDFVMALWDGMKRVMSELVAWLQERAAALTAPIKGLADTVRQYFPGDANAEAADISQSDGGGVNIAGAHAKGGPMSPGRTYLVGEQGPELVTPSRSGYVHPNGAGGGGMAPNISIHAPITISGATDADAVAAKVRRAISDELGSALRGGMSDYAHD